MALESRVGTVALNTSIGPQSITGFGFQPKLVLVQTTPSLANDANPQQDMHRSFGGFDGTNQFVTYNSGKYGNITPATSFYTTNTEGLFVASPAGTTTPYYQAQFSSLDVNGFTINLTTAPPSAYRMGYYALGGSDIQNVKVGTFQASTGAGSQAITGLGFQPNLIIFSSAYSTLLGGGGNAYWFLGMAKDSPIVEYSIGCYSKTGLGLPTTRTNQNDDASIYFFDTVSRGFANVTSFDADGFTLNWVLAPSGGRYIHYMAIQTSVTVALGHITLSNLTGAQAVSGLGIAPSNGIFWGNCSTLINTGALGASNEASIGFADESLFTHEAYHQDVNGVSQTRSYFSQNNTLIYDNWSYTGLPALTHEESASLTSFDADGFTLNLGVAGPANYLLYLLLGGGGAPPITGQKSFGSII